MNTQQKINKLFSLIQSAIEEYNLSSIFQRQFDLFALDEHNDDLLVEVKTFYQELLNYEKQKQNKKENENEKENKKEYDEKEVDEFLYGVSDMFKQFPGLTEFNQNQLVKMIQGKVQSGKSGVIAGIAIRNALVDKISTHIIVRNLTSDYEQLARKFREGGQFAHFGIPVIYCKNPDRQQLDIALRAENSIDYY